jgi:hypothetical protein
MLFGWPGSNLAESRLIEDSITRVKVDQICDLGYTKLRRPAQVPQNHAIVVM